MKLIEQFVKRILTEQIRKKFDISIPPDLQNVADAFMQSGYQLFLVGGSVRDAVQGKEPKDWDVATNASPEQVIDIFSDMRDHKLLTVGKSFGVVVIVTPEGNEYEVATFRKDIGSGRRPDAVEFTDISTDVQRRDLTINALFYDLQTHEVVDYVGGLKDIRDNVVRAVGNADQRFAEDRLRILRAFRFAGRMGAEFDPAISASIKRDNSLIGVSPERIRDEFLKGIKSAKSVVRFLSMLADFDMFKQVFPGLKVSTDFRETHNIPVQLALLLRDNDFVTLATKLNALKYSADEVSQVTFLIDFASIGNDMSITKMKKSYKNSRLKDSELLEFSRFLGIEDLAKKFLSFELTIVPVDLMSQGFKGKELGDEISRREQSLWLRS